MKLLIVADYNDADYIEHVIKISEETFNKFKPLIDAIENFEPYIRRDRYGGIDCDNWQSSRQDLGELSIYEKYSQFSREYINDFLDIFMGGMNDPEGCGFHTIKRLENIITDEVYIDYDYRRTYDKRSDKLREYENKRDELKSKLLSKKITREEEQKILYRLHNLWKEYT